VPPLLLVNYDIGVSLVNEMDKLLQDHEELMKEFKLNLQRSNSCMKQQEDAKCREVKFEVGDWVYLKLHPYRQSTVFKRAHQKLASHFFGPFQVIAKVRPVAYRLSLPIESKIHHVVRVSLLKWKLGEIYIVSKELP
jgi:hypothetical protein